ncbi:MAG: isopentenyl transferase family protein [Solirubrobacterales bacterium]
MNGAGGSTGAAGAAKGPFPDASGLPLISIFGPTAVGKTGVAVELGKLIADQGGSAVAVNCDSIQVYRGLEVISGAANAEQQIQLEHRLLSFVPVDEEYSAGRYAQRAHQEIDDQIMVGSVPLLVGGTGLYLRGALTDMEFRPPVPEEVRITVEADIEARGSAAVHEALPEPFRSQIHPNDRSRIARVTELLAEGRNPAENHAGGGKLWTAKLRRPSLLVGLVDEEKTLRKRIAVRVERMAAEGAADEAALAVEVGASRTALAAIGFEEFLSGDLERAATRHWQYARRQMTWMRRMDGVVVMQRQDRDDNGLAEAILALAGVPDPRNADDSPSG